MQYFKLSYTPKAGGARRIVVGLTDYEVGLLRGSLSCLLPDAAAEWVIEPDPRITRTASPTVISRQEMASHFSDEPLTALVTNTP